VKEGGGMEEIKVARCREACRRDSRLRTKRTKRKRARRLREMPIQIGVMLRVDLWGGVGNVEGMGVGVGRGLEVVVSFVVERAL
jgi:hypothetical protein